jgi:signal transduction histidine kinase
MEYMEIQRELSFTVEEESLLDMHSVLNVMNVIILELLTISEHTGAPPALDRLADRTVQAADHLRDPAEAHAIVGHIEEFIADVERTVGEAITPAGSEDRPEIAESRDNLRSIFAILRVRAREILARQSDPDGWVVHDISQLRDNFTSVFQAIERNSHGGYRIVNNVAEHENGNYLVNFEITSTASGTIRMPAIFQDVMRDLIANARKYTAPGGRIDAGLYNSGRELRFIVQDTGVGIPEDELAKVTEFGIRGTNVLNRETRGGGFGLTKAYYVTRKFDGRMWIDSSTAPPAGTRIEIRLPVPERDQHAP